MKQPSAFVTLVIIILLGSNVEVGHGSPPTWPPCPHLNARWCRPGSWPCECKEQCCSNRCEWEDRVGKDICWM
ncbi:unnamed protein product [Allacma fusca]|uniref:Uncharacterized protein n=1 Tax=Allacma fusca TaxID=39272 RepID=A0A8J2JB37_9HEXA|nr:unnamed protein product [Allacma fusca]